jgi:hypothetical protein
MVHSLNHFKLYITKVQKGDNICLERSAVVPWMERVQMALM